MRTGRCSVFSCAGRGDASLGFGFPPVGLAAAAAAAGGPLSRLWPRPRLAAAGAAGTWSESCGCDSRRPGGPSPFRGDPCSLLGDRPPPPPSAAGGPPRGEDFSSTASRLGDWFSFSSAALPARLVSLGDGVSWAFFLGLDELASSGSVFPAAALSLKSNTRSSGFVPRCAAA